MSMSTYLHKAKILVDKLVVTGWDVSTAEFNAIIHRNIGSEFHPIISALNLKTELVIFQELHSQLLAHEILLRSM